MKRLKNEAGFTLIELVVIIVILGILAVIAVPKYLDIRAEAEKGVANGITAALRGAVAISHAKYLMDNTKTYAASDIQGNIETEDVTVSSPGATTIKALFASGNSYTWTYTVRDGNTPATVAKDW